jgi:3-hydroxybutyrate dehydrogenase
MKSGAVRARLGVRAAGAYARRALLDSAEPRNGATAMLKGKSAVVTGSTSGIGLGIARALAAQGANVMLNGFGDAPQIEQLRAQLAAAHGVQVSYADADMSKPLEIAAMIAAAERAFGAVDILVNNAGIQHVAPVDEFPLEKWDQIIAINLSSAFHATRAALPGMKRRGWGRIVNVASAHGLVASPFKSAYIAAKHGVVGFTKTVALEVAKQGITCNAICPGYVLTPLVETQIEDQATTHGVPREEVIEKVMLERQPSKAFVKVEEVAALAVFLCSDGAASITGTPLSIDGGWVAQ